MMVDSENELDEEQLKSEFIDFMEQKFLRGWILNTIFTDLRCFFFSANTRSKYVRSVFLANSWSKYWLISSGYMFAWNCFLHDLQRNISQAYGFKKISFQIHFKLLFSNKRSLFIKDFLLSLIDQRDVAILMFYNFFVTYNEALGRKRFPG